jgi:glycosyltransferase involved in cell wall biosynthesis
MKVLVLQPGARHNYALARFLHRHGLLQRLYTDFAIARGGVLQRICGLTNLSRRVSAHDRRIVDEIPARLIRNVDWTVLLRRIARRPDAGDHWTISPRDVRETDIIYSQYYAGFAQMDALLAGGARLVSDVFIMPSAHRIVNREIDRFPDWGETPFSAAEAKHFDAFSREMIERSDALFCPSQAVIDDVATYAPDARSKCHFVRYGSSLSFAGESKPVEKRILFAGSVQLRKGPQYLAAAAARIARIDPQVRFIFAGAVSDTAARRLQADNIELLGHVSRERMREEFGRADLFVFPSLAEGSAGVVLEAMAAGVPVVATRAAGVDFSDGLSGRIVAEADVDELVSAIFEIIGNRPLRADMARHARSEILAYNESRWADCFIEALQRVIADE